VIRINFHMPEKRKGEEKYSRNQYYTDLAFICFSGVLAGLEFRNHEYLIAALNVVGMGFWIRFALHQQEAKRKLKLETKPETTKD
jgi:hypothetical protein